MKSSDKISFSHKTEKWLLFGILFLFVILNSINIKYPGIQYDEVLFANAALGGIDNSFIAYSIGKVPVLLMPYIGALKAYLYMPVFYMSGVSPTSIRLPMILLTAASIYLLFKAALTVFNRRIAWITLLLLCLDQNIVAHARMDVGPNAIEFFLKSLCLLLVFKFFKSRNHALLFFLFILFALGVFNKLNFAWFIVSLAIASFIFLFDILQKKITEKGLRAITKPFLIYLSALIPFIIYFIIINAHFNLPESFSVEKVAPTFTKKAVRIIDVIQGDSFYNFALGNIENPLASIYLFVIIAILIFGSATAILHKKDSCYYAKENFFLWVIIITTLLFIIITPRATKTWHAFTLQPVLSILVALCLYNTSQFLKNTRHIHESISAGPILFLLAAYHMILIGYYQTAYSRQKSVPFCSEAIYDLIDYTNDHEGKYFSADWGIHNQLITFHQDKERFKEVYWFFLNRKHYKQEEDDQLKNCMRETDDEHYFILRAKGAEYNRNAEDRLLQTASRFGVAIKEHKRFFDHSDNQDIFVIYSIE